MHISMVEVKIGPARGYLNTGSVANNSFAGDEITATASKG